MRRRNTYLACAGAVIALAAPTAAVAAPVTVNVRIEGRTQTLFDGPMSTKGEIVTPSSGDDHLCDGTNGGANTTPGGTPTTAMNDATNQIGSSWDGSYDTGFDDYFVTRIGPDTQNTANGEYWGDFVNESLSNFGGCQETVRTGDRILWVYDAFNKVGLLEASGPDSVRTGESFAVTVTDSSGTPQQGAKIGGETTDAAGHVSLDYGSPGDYTLKAEKPNYVRSPAITVHVREPDGSCATCGSPSPTSPSPTSQSQQRDTIAPLITDLSASQSVFSVDSAARASAVAGTRFSFSLSEPSTVIFRTEQRSRGRWKTIRVFGKRYDAGPGLLRYSGRIKPRGKARSLKPGRYRLSLRPSDHAGNRGKVSRVGFRIVR